MNSSGQVALQSQQWLSGHTADRPTFDGYISRGLGGQRKFSVFAMTKGLLFLDKGNGPASGGMSDGQQRAVMTGAVMGGLVGGLVGGLIASGMSGPQASAEPRYDMCSDDDLIDLAKARKHSFVAPWDSISSISIDPPGLWARLLGGSQTVGRLTLREKKLGKVTMEIRDPLSMSVAIEALPRRLNYRVQVNLRFDERARTYVAR